MTSTESGEVFREDSGVIYRGLNEGVMRTQLVRMCVSASLYGFVYS